MDLDFSELTNDQLIGLIRAACAEAVNRGASVAAAAHGIYLDAVEKARITHAATLLEAERLRQAEVERVAREAAEKLRREADRQKVDAAADVEAQLWARRKGIAQAIASTGYDVAGDQIVVWLSATKEKRVFLQAKGFGGFTYATLFVTGNSRHAPDSFEFKGGLAKDIKDSLKPVLRAIAQEWNAFKVDLPQALAWAGAATPLRHLHVEQPAAPAGASA